MIGWLKKQLALRFAKEVFEMAALKGYRTYIVLAVILGINALEQFAGVDSASLDPLKQWLYPIAIGFLRAGAKA